VNTQKKLRNDPIVSGGVLNSTHSTPRPVSHDGVYEEVHEIDHWLKALQGYRFMSMSIVNLYVALNHEKSLLRLMHFITRKYY